MDVDTRSSSNDLSSAPSSDVEGPFPSLLNHSHLSNAVSTQGFNGSATPTHNPNSAARTGSAAQSSATRQDAPPVKPQRKPRKKKEVDPNAPPAPEKEKKTRKPRASAGTTTATSRKRVKTDNDPPAAIISQNVLQATDLNSSRLVQPAPFLSDTKPVIQHEAAKITQNGFSNQNPAMMSQPQSPTLPRQPPMPPSRSGKHFDPVRGIEVSSDSTPTITYPTLNETPPRQPFRPSASPAISSIINHPEVKPAMSLTYQPASRSLGRQTEETITVNGTTSTLINLDGSSSSEAPPKKSPPTEKVAPEADAKQKRAKEQPAPVSVGSGLLNSTFFGGDSSNDKDATSGKGVSIVLQIDLNDERNKVFNFARMAEEKYGFAAVYPRQAAQRERLAKVAAAGAALEKLAPNGKRGELSVGESGDEDLSADVDRDSDNDGDITMTGVNGTNENSGTDGPTKKQRKKRKDEYDAEDPFVDDSEMLWEAQAATSKDGFFVYMGPLVAEGEKTTVERAEGGPAKRGRGRGRGGGPGSRGGRGAASAGGGENSTRGGGPGSRGGNITRKPRITKAERAQRELEKKQREQAGTSLAARPTPTPAPAPAPV